MLRIATVFEPRGLSITVLKGSKWPSSTNKRILHGVVTREAIEKFTLGRL